MTLTIQASTVIKGQTTVGFSPASLFSAGEQGVWYDPSDMSTMFQDSAGTTPVTAVEQPVGRILDKSGRGNHATQATAGSRPTLSARVNLLTKTEDFSNAVWVRNANTNSTATKISAAVTGTTNFVQVTQVASKAAASLVYTYVVEIKRDELQYASPGVSDNGANGIYCRINLADGSVYVAPTAYGTGFSGTVSTSVLSDGYVRVIWTITTNAATSIAAAVSGHKLSDASNTSYTAGEGVLVRNADLRLTNQGVGLPAYQRVNTATDYDTTGFPMYLKFDGSATWMATANINLASTASATYWIGLGKDSDAAWKWAFNFGNPYLTQSGSFGLTAPENLAPDYGFSVRGSSLALYAPTSYAAPITSVASCAINITGAAKTDVLAPRINGVLKQSGGSGTTTGATAFGNYPLTLGLNGSQTLNGRIYSLIVRGAASTSAQIAATEAYVNSRTKAY